MKKCGGLAVLLQEFLSAYLFRYFNFHSLVGNQCRLTWVRHCSHKSRTAPIATVRVVFSCVKIMVWLPLFRFLTHAQILMHMVAHGGCMDIVTITACTGRWLGEKITCCTGGLEPTSVLYLAFHSDILPSELSLPQCLAVLSWITPLKILVSPWLFQYKSHLHAQTRHFFILYPSKTECRPVSSTDSWEKLAVVKW